jgi:hypothetical protein
MNTAEDGQHRRISGHLNVNDIKTLHGCHDRVGMGVDLAIGVVEHHEQCRDLAPSGKRPELSISRAELTPQPLTRRAPASNNLSASSARQDKALLIIWLKSLNL